MDGGNSQTMQRGGELSGECSEGGGYVHAEMSYRRGDDGAVHLPLNCRRKSPNASSVRAR